MPQQIISSIARPVAHEIRIAVPPLTRGRVPRALRGLCRRRPSRPSPRRPPSTNRPRGHQSSRLRRDQSNRSGLGIGSSGAPHVAPGASCPSVCRRRAARACGKTTRCRSATASLNLEPRGSGNHIMGERLQTFLRRSSLSSRLRTQLCRPKRDRAAFVGSAALHRFRVAAEASWQSSC